MHYLFLLLYFFSSLVSAHYLVVCKEIEINSDDFEGRFNACLPAFALSRLKYLMLQINCFNIFIIFVY